MPISIPSSTAPDRFDRARRYAVRALRVTAGIAGAAGVIAGFWAFLSPLPDDAVTAAQAELILLGAAVLLWAFSQSAAQALAKKAAGPLAT